MLCPCCGMMMRFDWGLTGTAPAYKRVRLYRCTRGYACDLVGYGLTAVTLADVARLRRLAAINRAAHTVQRARRHLPEGTKLYLYGMDGDEAVK